MVKTTITITREMHMPAKSEELGEEEEELRESTAECLDSHDYHGLDVTAAELAKHRRDRSDRALGERGCTWLNAKYV